jgi:hypothetical protein
MPILFVKSFVKLSWVRLKCNEGRHFGRSGNDLCARHWYKLCDPQKGLYETKLICINTPATRKYK